MVYSVAVRDRQRGRGSGGLVILIKKNIPFEELNTSNLWIFIKISLSPDRTLIIGNIYVSPNFPLSQALESLKLQFDELNIQSDYIIIGGDTNARISNDNYLDEHLAEEYGLLAQRISRDELLNRRGEDLISCMEDHGFLVLNGRTDGDVPGQNTYLSRVGTSVVDLVWANLESCKLVSELRVSDTVIVSDHFPVILSLEVFQEEYRRNISQSNITRFKFLPEKAVEFSNIVNSFGKPLQVATVYEILV